MGERPEGVTCKAIQGLIAEGQEVLDEFRGGEALDAGLIAAAQAIEHYEITRYGTLLAWAKQLRLSEAEGLLQETLVEEENTDELLSKLGFVTRTGVRSQRPVRLDWSGRSGRNLPGLRRLGPEDPKCAAGDEVALKVERVVDRSMHRQKALS